MTMEMTDHAVLIVEDEIFSDIYLTEILKKNFRKILHARNGKQAIEIVKKTKDLLFVLMDIKMPLMDGLTATRKIREFNTDIPIIAQTAYALEGDREKALAAGCNAYISKPIDKELLVEMIQDVVLNKQE